MPSLSGASRHASHSPVTTDGQSGIYIGIKLLGKKCYLGMADVGSR